MATGKVKDPRNHVEFYGKDTLSDWFILDSKFTVGENATDVTLRKVSDNIWNVYMCVHGPLVVGAPNANILGKFRFSFFGGHPVACYLPTIIGGDLPAQVPAVAKLAGTSGNLTICSAAAYNDVYVYVHGLFIVREDTTADNEQT